MAVEPRGIGKKMNTPLGNMIASVIIIIFGLIPTIWGSEQRNSSDYKFLKEAKELGKSLGVKYDKIDDLVIIDIVFYVGIVFLVLGILLLLFHGFKFITTGNGSGASFSAPKSGFGGINKPNFNSAGTVKTNNFKCAACGAFMDATMQFCPECGCPDKVPAQPQPAPVANAHCGNCGATLKPGEAFCPECGSRN